MKSERKKKVFESLEGAKSILDDVITDLHDGKVLKDLKLKIWKSYSLIEYSIGITKLELKEENRKYKPINFDDQRSAIIIAFDKIDEALGLIREDSSKALDKMRDARDILKEILISIRPPRKRD